MRAKWSCLTLTYTKPAQPQSSKNTPPESLKLFESALEVVATLVTAVADTANKKVQKSKRFKNISKALNASECKNSQQSVLYSACGSAICWLHIFLWGLSLWVNQTSSWQSEEYKCNPQSGPPSSGPCEVLSLLPFVPPIRASPPPGPCCSPELRCHCWCRWSCGPTRHPQMPPGPHPRRHSLRPLRSRLWLNRRRSWPCGGNGRSCLWWCLGRLSHRWSPGSSQSAGCPSLGWRDAGLQDDISISPHLVMIYSINFTRKLIRREAQLGAIGQRLSGVDFPLNWTILCHF